MKLVVIALLLLGTALAAHSVEDKLRELLKKMLDERQEPLVLAQHSVGEALVGKSLEERGLPRPLFEITAFDENGNKKQMSMEDMCLDAHNKVRALHENTPPLVYDEGLARGAAHQVRFLARIGKLIQTSERVLNGKGENIFHAMQSQSLGSAAEPLVVSPAAAVFSWYEESWKVNHMDQPYDYNSENIPGTGNFTQVVWKGSSKVGCGVATIARKGMQHTFIIARYEEAANVEGAYLDNVLPLKPGAQHPENAGSLVASPGCLNYGANCGQFSDQCSTIGDVCACTCS